MLLQNKRVFIVEDDAGNLAVASVYLRQQGALVSYERWGRETAQAILAQMPIDIILMDLMFPNNVSGFDVFDQIRQPLGEKKLLHKTGGWVNAKPDRTFLIRFAHYVF